MTESEWITKWNQESEEPVWVCEELFFPEKRTETDILDSGETRPVVGKEWIEKYFSANRPMVTRSEKTFKFGLSIRGCSEVLGAIITPLCSRPRWVELSAHYPMSCSRRYNRQPYANVGVNECHEENERIVRLRVESAVGKQTIPSATTSTSEWTFGITAGRQ